MHASSHSDDSAPPGWTGSRLIDVAALIDAAPISALQMGVFALTLATSVLDGFDTMSMSFLAPSIRGAWHTSPGLFGLVFSGTLLGAAIGAVLFGALADRFGRRRLILAAVAWFGLLTLACAAAPDLRMLIILRVLAGLGLGGAYPNLLALAAEYLPVRRRSTGVSIITWGTPLGAIFSGLLAAPMIAAWGWRSVLYFAGASALALLLPLLLALPESARYLALRPQNQARLRAILQRITPDRAIPAEAGFTNSERAPGRVGFAALFQGGFAPATVLLAAAMFTSLLLSFLLVNWTPTLLKQAGFGLHNAILGTVILNFSGIVGSLLIALLVDRRRRGGVAVLGLTYVCTVLAVSAAGIATGIPATPVALLMLCLALSGFFLIGSQISLSAYITAFYPTAVRGTAVGFNNAVARCGSLLGPALGGWMLGAGVSPSHLLLAGTLPGALSAAALFALAGILRRQRGQRAGAEMPRDEGGRGQFETTTQTL